MVGLRVEWDSGVKGQTPTLHQAVSVEEPGRQRGMDDSLLISSFPLKITFASRCRFKLNEDQFFCVLMFRLCSVSFHTITSMSLTCAS